MAFPSPDGSKRLPKEISSPGSNRLATFTSGRDNNFNLIRIVAASAVLVTHGFFLATGKTDAEPLQTRLGVTLGNIAVDVFFITSGFLVTGSLLKRQSIVEFAWARALRVFPALWTMLLITVFGLGLGLTSVPRISYLTNKHTYGYLTRCATLLGGVSFALPGVFDANPYRGSVNGSLWTMPFELRMYVALAGVWMLVRWCPGDKSSRFKLAVLGCFSAGCILIAVRRFAADADGLQLFFMFFSGAAFYVCRDHITLRHTVFWLLITALVSSALLSKPAFQAIYLLTVTYLLFYLAYIPAGYIRHYNRLGDYSYGVYIYAFPVQQSVAALVPGVSVWSMVLISAPVTLLLAMLSWHLLEHRALALKTRYVGHTRRMFLRRPAPASAGA